MTLWVYLKDGKPVSVEQEELKALYRLGYIQADTIIWPEGNAEGKTTISASGLFAQAEGAESTTPPKSTANMDDPEAFLSSEITKALIGPRNATYIERWREKFDGYGPDWQTVFKKPSWCWPAFLLPTFWFSYRKLYSMGAIISTATTLLAVLPGHWSAANGGLCAGAGVAAGSLYLRKVYQMWAKLASNPDNASAQREAEKIGGVNIWAGLAGCLLPVLCAGVIELARKGDIADFFTLSSTSCSSEDTISTLTELAREQMDQTILMADLYDSVNTSIHVERIITRFSNGRKWDCAAVLKYDFAPKPAFAAALKAKQAPLTGAVNVTYTVEKTDSDDEIVVTLTGN